MIVATVKYEIVEGSMDVVCELSRGIQAFARSCKGNIEYSPAPYPYAENTMFSLEKWESLEDMKAYCDSDECKTFQEKRNAYLVDGTMSAQVYEVKEVPLSTVMQR